MKQYLELCQDILNNGVEKSDRTGTGTISVFGRQLRFNLAEGFPLLTTKKIHFKSVLGELLWFLSGSTNKFELKEKYGVSIWDEWGDNSTGELGPIYSSQWRNWHSYSDDGEIVTIVGIDQITNLIRNLKAYPDSRRHLISAWNVGELELMALPPCHYAFQFYVANGRLSCLFNMRSNDTFLGLPFNIASYALLTMMIAQVVGLELGELIYIGGDVHIYKNHIEQVKLQLSRKPRPLPKVYLNPNVTDIFKFKIEDFILDEYEPYPGIKGIVAI